MHQIVRIACTAALAITLIAVIDYASSVLEAPGSRPALNAQFVYVPDPRLLRALSLGHTGALADLLWFRTISYFGDHYYSDRLYPWLFRMCDVVTDLDPKALHVYRFAGVILPWEANRPDDGIALLEKGLQHFPDSWYLHWLVGFNYYFFKDDLQNASDHLRRAAELPGTHPYVSRLAAIVYAHGHDPAAAESFLVDLERSTQDDEMRGVISLRLGELKLGRDIETLATAIDTYQRQVGTPPADLETLVDSGVLAQLPEEPFGGRYQLDPNTGKISTTSGHAPLKLYESKARQEYRKGNPVSR